MVIGSMFFISGIIMALAVRKYYPDFYKEFGNKVWLATFCLTLPLYVRALHSSQYKEGSKYYKFYGNNFAVMNSAYVFFSSILPVLA